MDEQPPIQSSQNTNPQQILDQIRQKLEGITIEYSAGTLNAIQFNAMYRHYMEQRTIIEKLLERNPDTDAWKAAATQGKTMHLRDKFEARALYFVVFRRDAKKPLRSGGKIPKKAAEQIHSLLKVMWRMTKWRKGLAQKSLGDGMWMLLMVGDLSFTITIFFFQPSTLQTNRVRDLHADFERANRQLLEKNMPPERMVFPQRSLVED